MKKLFILFALIWFFTFLNGTSFAQVPDWLWAKSAGGTDLDDGYSVAVDSYGNVFVTGYFSSPVITFGSYTLTNAGYGDMFLAKYDANGNVLWAKSAGGTDFDDGYSVAVDSYGNVFVTGVFVSPTLTFGSNTLINAGCRDIFIAKYDASGNVLWAKSAGGIDLDDGYSVAVDTYGNVFVTGYFSSPVITFGSYTLTNAGGGDMFLTKYDASGNVLWAKSTDGAYYNEGYSVAVDLSGNVYVTGYFSGLVLTVGSYTLTNAGDGDMFLAKYDASGNVLWAKSAGRILNEYANSVAVDSYGNVYVTGVFASPTLSFGSDTLTNAGDGDMFLAKYDASGNVLWAKSVGGTDFDAGYSVAVDSYGNVFVTGYFSSPVITFGSYTLTNAGNWYAFLTKYNANGNVLWAKSAGGTDSDLGYSVAVDLSGNVYVTGYFSSPVLTFGSYILTNAGDGDMFLVKIKSISNIGFNEPIGTFDLLIYPNPTEDKLYIQTAGKANNSNFSIFNVKGKQFFQQQFTTSTITLDISSLPSGVYFVRVVGDKSVSVEKFIKQ